MIGYRKWALAAYLVLAMYLLARPATDELSERARLLDEHLQNHSAAILSPALAAALAMPEQPIERRLQKLHTKPSELVFDKLLERTSPARGDVDSAAQVIESGVSMNEALGYFDAIEKRVTEHLHHLSAKNAQELPSTLAAAPPNVVHGKPAHE